MQKQDKKESDGIITCNDILKDLEGLDTTNTERMSRIMKEFSDGFKFIKKYPKSVTFFGSARLPETSPDYERARMLGKLIVEKLGYAIVTGGGLGIMEAGNRGASEANGDAIGFLIRLPKEQSKNPYVTDFVDFNYFFSRKVAMSFSAEAYVVFPGGFGTMNELFEILTLVQTRKITNVPIILMGKEFWNPLQEIINKELYQKYNVISKEDLKLYTITDDINEALEIIKKAPIRNE